MPGDLLALMWAPFLMCLVLTGIHAYLGIHVIAREVVFVDIALAQIAALGATAAFLVGFTLESWVSYAFALGTTLVGALVLSLTRTRERRVSQEAVIGVVYAVSAAAGKAGACASGTSSSMRRSAWWSPAPFASPGSCSSSPTSSCRRLPAGRWEAACPPG
jgi:ABC-type Mn2+/Zn2+ transport system permease subunit